MTASPADIVAFPVFAAGSLTDLDRAPQLFGRYPMYEPAVAWLEGFVAQPHPQLRRGGHVCPRLAPAMARNQVWLVALHTERSCPEEARDTGQHLANLFEALFPTPVEARAGALLGFFPDLGPADGAAFIDRGHQLLRMPFVERGLMIGEFHPSSTVASVHNPDLLVMRCPVPMFAVRALSRHDLLFLDRPDCPPADLAAYLSHYLRHLDDQLTHGERDRVSARLQAIGETQ
jgi:hypothetical protein